MKQNNHAVARQNGFNTSAQSGNTNYTQPAVIIQGKGSEIGNEKAVKGKAKRKNIGGRLALALVDVAKRKGDEEMQKTFWNTWHCQSRLVSTDSRTYGNYCKNRNCPLCCSIRKATLIEKYLPTIQTWKDPYFVTLTIKSCPAKRLPEMMEAMIRAIKIITTKFRKKRNKGCMQKLQGIRALECCFNPIRRTYNPHFHIVVPDKETADILIKKWLELWTPKYAGKIAQKCRPIGTLEKDLIETIKYGAKIFTEPDMKKNKKPGNRNPVIYAAALYNIFAAMKGLRLFDRFGFNLPKTEMSTNPARVITEYDEWKFKAGYNDWLGVDNEQVLSGYRLSLELEEILKNGIDKQLE